jgi:hypothetical protein
MHVTALTSERPQRIASAHTLWLGSRRPRSKADSATRKRSRGAKLPKCQCDVNACETIEVVATAKKFRYLNRLDTRAISDVIPASQA